MPPVAGGDRDAAGTIKILPRVLPVPRGDKEWYLYAARAGLSRGALTYRVRSGLNTIASGEVRTNRPALPPFSLIMVRRRRCLALKRSPDQVRASSPRRSSGLKSLAPKEARTAAIRSTRLTAP